MNDLQTSQPHPPLHPPSLPRATHFPNPLIPNAISPINHYRPTLFYAQEMPEKANAARQTPDSAAALIHRPVSVGKRSAWNNNPLSVGPRQPPHARRGRRRVTVRLLRSARPPATHPRSRLRRCGWRGSSSSSRLSWPAGAIPECRPASLRSRSVFRLC